MNKTASIILMVAIVIGGIILLSGNSNRNSVGSDGKNVEIRDGVQYITIDARGGYSPNVSTAKAGIPSKLIVSTNGTYDCSAALVIRSANYQEVLPPTGQTEIDIGTPKAGEPLRGTCGMGMYNFVVNFD